MTFKVLASDKISKDGIAVFEKAGITLEMKTGLSEEELIGIIADYDALVVRSETRATRKIIEAGKKLKIIGRAGVGVDNIDLAAATEKGVIVVNSPEGNTIAAAEHSVAMLLSMARKIPQAYVSLVKEHKWDRSSFKGVEVYGKTLGVVGLGKIGSHVAKCMQGMGMKVIGYDPFVTKEIAEAKGIELLKLDDVLSKADFITLHIPKTDETKGMLNKAKFAIMKDGVRIVNCARGGIIVEADLAEACKSGKVASAAMDVFAVEPTTESPMFDCDNIVSVPHLGASTEEAQVNVAVDVAEQIVTVLQGGNAASPVNIPTMKPALIEPVKPYISLAEKLGKFIGQMIGSNFTEVEIYYKGDITQVDPSPLSTIVLKGIMEALNPEGLVNFVNAPVIAKAKGISIRETKVEKAEDYANAIQIKIKDGDSVKSVSGSLFASLGERIIEVNGYSLTATPQGNLLLLPHQDKPGLVGKIGDVLGQNNINIAGMQVGRDKVGGKAVMLINVDNELSADLLNKISEIDGIQGVAKLIKF